MSTATTSRSTVSVDSIIEEPEQWGVLLLFDGELLCGGHQMYPSPLAAAARAAELRARFPRHDVRLVRRTVVWTEVEP